MVMQMCLWVRLTVFANSHPTFDLCFYWSLLKDISQVVYNKHVMGVIYLVINCCWCKHGGREDLLLSQKDGLVFWSTGCGHWFPKWTPFLIKMESKGRYMPKLNKFCLDAKGTNIVPSNDIEASQVVFWIPFRARWNKYLKTAVTYAV